MALSKAQLEKFEKQLLEWRKELDEGLHETIQSMHQEEQTAFPDPTDQATIETDRNFDLRIKDRERKLIKKIDAALAKIDTGEYGYCEQCGVEIGIRRLEARPTATLCIDCKSLDEIREKTRA